MLVAVAILAIKSRVNTDVSTDTNEGSAPFRSNRVKTLLECMFAQWIIFCHTKCNITVINVINYSLPVISCHGKGSITR